MIKLAPGLELPDAAITQTFGILAKRGAGKSNAAAVMAEEMHTAGFQFVAIDPVGAWWGLRSSADGKGPGLEIPILGGYRGDVPLEPTAGELVADLIVDERLSCVVDVSAFDSESAKRRFLIAFAERLFKQKGRPGHDDPLHLFLEEADDYAPQRATGVEMNRCLGAFQRIVKRGRSRGLGSTMITQRSAALNKDLLTQIDTLLVLRTTSPNDRKVIEEWIRFHDVDHTIVATLSGLQAGEAWVWSPEFLGLVERVQIRRRRTFDSGATPTTRSKTRAPATLADVDLGQLEQRMAETIERAKAEDPKQLRKRIAELERALQKRDVTVAQPERIVELVEVPVLTEEHRAHLERQVELLEQYVSPFELLAQSMATAARDITAAIASTMEPRPAVTPPARGPRAAVPVSPPRPRPRGPDRQLAAGTASTNGRVGRSQQKLLDALALLGAIGVPIADKKQLALLAGVSPTSGGYFNNLGTLRTAGLIDYPQGGTVQLTDAGRAIADPGDVPRTDEALHARVFALKNVGPAKQRILEPLIRIYPDFVRKETLAEEIGVSPTSGGYFNNLGALRTLGLIDYPAPGYVAAEPILFLAPD